MSVFTSNSRLDHHKSWEVSIRSRAVDVKEMF